MCGERSQRGKGPPQHGLFSCGSQESTGEPVCGIIYSLHIYGIPSFHLPRLGDRTKGSGTISRAASLDSGLGEFKKLFRTVF